MWGSSVILMSRVGSSGNFEEGGPLGHNWQAKSTLPGTKKKFWKLAILKLFSRPGLTSKPEEDGFKFRKDCVEYPVHQSDSRELSLTAKCHQTGAEDVTAGRDGTTKATRAPCDGLVQSILFSVSFEALVAICEELGEADRVKLRFVSRELRSLFDQGDWYWRRMTTQYMTVGAVKSLVERTRDLPWSLRFAERNLICNPSGTKGLEGWRVATRKFAILKNNNIRPGYRWTVERLDPAQAGSMAPSDSFCFMASRCQCTKSQLINLVERGFSPSFLDTYQPPIHMSDSFASRWDGLSMYSLTGVLLDANFRAVAHFTSGDLVCKCASSPEEAVPFKRVEFLFKSYGAGVRFVFFEHSGFEDMGLWRGEAGHYGPYMKDACVTVLALGERNEKTIVNPLLPTWQATNGKVSCS